MMNRFVLPVIFAGGRKNKQDHAAFSAADLHICGRNGADLQSENEEKTSILM